MWHHFMVNINFKSWSFGTGDVHKIVPPVLSWIVLLSSPVYSYSSIKHKPRLAYFKTHVPRWCHFVSICTDRPHHSHHSHLSKKLRSHRSSFSRPRRSLWRDFLGGKQPSWSPIFQFFGWLSADFWWWKTGFFKPRIRIHPARKHWGFEHV